MSLQLASTSGRCSSYGSRRASSCRGHRAAGAGLAGAGAAAGDLRRPRCPILAHGLDRALVLPLLLRDVPLPALQAAERRLAPAPEQSKKKKAVFLGHGHTSLKNSRIPHTYIPEESL